MNSFRTVFDFKQDGVYWCTADVGWITGHSYICYGPLANGATQVVFEGVPTYPNASRFWRMIQDHKVSIFYTAPTAIRSLIKLGSDLPDQFDLSSLRLLGTVGETDQSGSLDVVLRSGGRQPLPDRGHLVANRNRLGDDRPAAGAVPTKPGSCTLPLPGIIADIVDESGAQVEPGRGGFLVIKKPFPSLVRTIWGDPDRFKKTYFPEEFNGQYYLAGDSANRDENGYFWIMGRIDDVLNVSGHRLGTMEIESALVANPLVAEAAVVGKPHDVKGEAVVAFVVLKGARPEGEEAKKIAAELKAWVAHEITRSPSRTTSRFGENLPKTRSGKDHAPPAALHRQGRRDHQDVSTLENPHILGQLKDAV